MQSIAIKYYDGIINRAHVATLRSHASGAVVEYTDAQNTAQQKLYHYDDMLYIGPIGAVLPAIELPNDARIEFLDAQLPDWLQLKSKQQSQRVHAIESSWRWIALSLVVTIAVIFSTFRWGIPLAAHTIAQQMPRDSLQRLGDQAENYLIELTEPSKISRARQQQIQVMYRTKINAKYPAKILFREGGNRIGANALAIPNGRIILTDELVKLAKNDQELLAVLAHEQGHLDGRHSLEQGLQSLGISILYVSITGDASDLFGSLPVALVSSQYSQKFELQADQHAIDELKRQGISPQYLADFLQRLSEENEEESSSLDFLQSHPATSERIAQVKAQL
ncbi:Peptidase family M48 [Acinetobacter marinus]|uniref:Peptidase family M48 n=1 Tax=Acinetobacter marinus TaxID=281375 RepID=A0A1G6IVZ7_9GAMM|nr:M48 family metallopeptidase [Acinetobacter marinus]SDC10590.1 Peptidase family M48 [Acinetobacter marinus]